MLLLGATNPRYGVKQQVIVVPRGQPGEFAAGPMQQDGAQPPNLTVDVMGHNGSVGPCVGTIWQKRRGVNEAFILTHSGFGPCPTDGVTT
ncbi:hypothetical protein GCM10009779_03890 [Polymorphospora rubra]|uniref:Uncharacterized protein n=1 Tax=Polymorphospora rubra TaxID=338584 RepID=A0A810N021_9ACTN|nr:hypothetical protein Prubr_25900 [Polymorphospora rubra]